MKGLLLHAALVTFCLVSSHALAGQIVGQIAPTSGSTGDTTHAPDADGGMSSRVEGLFIPLITGQPFRAKVEVQVNRQLPDGTAVAQKYYTQVARDSAGREYREGRDLVPADSDREPPLLRTMIYDPKTSLETACIPDRRICRQTGFDPTSRPVEESAGPSGDGKSTLTRESLGTKTIDGIEVQGTRETRTFNPGAFGNDKPIIVTKEIWYSPQLQFNLEVTRNDPRSGTQKFEVTGLKLGDPGPEWFTLPDGYRMVQDRIVANRASGPAELEPLIEKLVTGMTPDELSTVLAPVEAAIGVYAKAHAAAAPNDRNEQFAGQMRQRLSTDLRMFQQMNQLPGAQMEDASLRLSQTYRQVLDSPCLSKPQPGDPPNMPSSADALREEQQAWNALRSAWTAFLTKLFPNADPARFAWMLTNDRIQELRRIETVERNRGCVVEDSIEPELERVVTGMTPDQLTAAVKPVDAAIAAYVKTQPEIGPNSRSEFFGRQVQQQMRQDLTAQQQGQVSKSQAQDADVRLNQLYTSVIDSPCLSKPQPGDPPNMPSSADALREQQQAWLAMRDAWKAFLATLFPNSDPSGFGWMLTNQRNSDLQRVQDVLRNRGCVPVESIEPLLKNALAGMTPEQLATAVKPLDTAIAAYARAHAAAAPNDRNQYFVNQVQMQMLQDLNVQQSQRPTQDQFEEADLHLIQAWRAIIASPCLSKSIPGDPANAPVSADTLRAEQQAWVSMRDAWTTFLRTVFPNNDNVGFGTQLTMNRANELRQIQNIERNRGCTTDAP